MFATREASGSQSLKASRQNDPAAIMVFRVVVLETHAGESGGQMVSLEEGKKKVLSVKYNTAV